MKDYIFGAIILVLLGLLGWSLRNNSKQSKECQQTVAEKQTLIDSLVTSKTREVVKWDTVTKYITRNVTRYHAVDSVKVYEIIDGRQVSDFSMSDFDTSTIIYKKLYLDTLFTSDFTLPYRLSLWGDLDYLVFNDYDLFDKTVTKEHVVYVPKEVVREVNKTHLYAYFMFGSSFSIDKNYSYEGGLNLIFKNQFGVSLGYHFYEVSMFKAGFSFKLL